MTEYEKLCMVIVWHDYAIKRLSDGIAALLEATDFDATPAERHEARSVAANDVVLAMRALEQMQPVETTRDDES